MQEKFRLRMDLNDITDIHDIDNATALIEKFPHIKAYHRYSYLFLGYHQLTHGKIDDETFFTIGDISSEKTLFPHEHISGLESLFTIEANIADDTLYIIESSSMDYYIGKRGWDAEFELGKQMTVHGSHFIVV